MILGYVIKKFAATQGDSENIGYYFIDNIRDVKRRSYYKEISQIFQGNISEYFICYVYFINYNYLTKCFALNII